MFSSEKEIIQTLDQICSGAVADSGASLLPFTKYSDMYKRCSRVLSRLLNLAQSRNLIWEVDASLYPDYYTIISRPVMYTGIAAALINQQYTFPESMTSNEVDEETLIGALFAADLMQVPINCIVFNSEITPVVAQAYKMIHASHRMLNAWIFSPTRPPLTMLADTFCLLTQEYIVQNDNLKCGKCTGCFCYSALENTMVELSDKKSPGSVFSAYYIAPTQEIVDQVNEEWLCPLCLYEDSNLLHHELHPASLTALYGVPFCIDEWGPSSKVPWALNPDYCTIPATIDSDFPYLSPLVKALRVLSQNSRSPVLPVQPGTTHIIAPAHLRNSKHITSGKDIPTASSDWMTSWSFQERVSVLLALAVVFRSTDKSMDFMHSINSDCEKLIKISSKPNFREADFMSAVKVSIMCRTYFYHRMHIHKLQPEKRIKRR